jgi:hypothetical protein
MLEEARLLLENVDTEREWIEAKALVQSLRALADFEKDLFSDVDQARKESHLDGNRY